MPTINIILANVENGGLILPTFQRGYVWRRWQVRDLFDSLYKGHPVGSLLTWLTTRNGIRTELLLDGQQRVTSLYGVIKGRAPKFFSGDARAFKNLYFHAKDERFEFYQPIKMKGDPFWFDVTKVMQAGPEGIFGLLSDQFEANAIDPQLSLKIMQALNRLVGLGAKNFHIEQIADDSKKNDEVVDIFNRLNSAGTRLSKGDLALAKVAVKWPDVRNEMREVIQKWSKHDFDFTLDWLLRCVNAVIYGEAAFVHLHNISRNTFEDGLKRTVKHVNTVLNQIKSRLGLDHHRVLFAKFAIPVLVRHLELCKHRKMSAAEWDLLLYWFLRAGIQGRFSGSTETRIRESLVAVDGTLTGVERLIAEIGTTWGRPRILAADFDSSTIGARAYPVLYWLTRVGGARDFCYGTKLQAYLLGEGSQLQVHHIFPKAGLYDAKYTYERAQVNALGNFCFLTADCNQWIGAALPAESSKFVSGNQDKDRHRIGSEGYFYWVREKYPGVLESQWIPMDEELWKVKNYPDFLNARRKLLAIAANKYLGDLNPRHAETEDVTKLPDQVVEPVKSPPHIASPDEESELRDIQEWMKSCRLPQGEFGYELEGNGVMIDLAWQNGLPEGIGRPVALLLNESAETYRTVSQAGYDCFTDVRSFKKYVDTEIAGE